MTWIIPIIGVIVSLFFGKTVDRFYEGMVYGIGGTGLLWFICAMVDKLKITFLDLTAAAVTGYLVWANTAGKLPLPPLQPDPVAKKRTPLLPWRKDAVGQFVEGDAIGPDGVEVQADIIPEIRKKNIASKGLGCCVFRSVEHTAREQNIPALYDFAEWMVKSSIEGGGYPDKVDQLITRICKERKVDVPPYLQHEGGDPKFLELALKNGWSVCVTYCGRDPRYSNQNIAHMVNLVYIDDKYACILDNNFIDKYYWMSRKEFLDRWNEFGKSKGWAIAFLTSPSIPVIRN